MTLRTSSSVSATDNARTRQLAARRSQFIAVAEQLFLKQGFAKTSVNAIVREAGGSLATLYAEFGTKEALFESVLSRRAATFFPEDRSAPRKPLDAQTELRALAAHMLRRMLSDDGMAVYRIISNGSSRSREQCRQGISEAVSAGAFLR